MVTPLSRTSWTISFPVEPYVGEGNPADESVSSQNHKLKSTVPAQMERKPQLDVLPKLQIKLELKSVAALLP
jgi:hypothetical protein